MLYVITCQDTTLSEVVTTEQKLKDILDDQKELDVVDIRGYSAYRPGCANLDEGERALEKESHIHKALQSLSLILDPDQPVRLGANVDLGKREASRFIREFLEEKCELFELTLAFFARGPVGVIRVQLEDMEE